MVKIKIFSILLLFLHSTLFASSPFSQKRDNLRGIWANSKYAKKFEIYNNKITGIYNCNRFFAIIYESGGKVYITNKYVGREYSCKRKISINEKKFFDILFNSNKVVLNGDTLVIYSQIGKIKLQKMKDIYVFN